MKFSNEIVRLILTVSKFLMGDFTVYFYGLFFSKFGKKRNRIGIGHMKFRNRQQKKKETVQFHQKISQNSAVLYGFHLRQITVYFKPYSEPMGMYCHLRK